MKLGKLYRFSEFHHSKIHSPKYWILTKWAGSVEASTQIEEWPLDVVLMYLKTTPASSSRGPGNVVHWFLNPLGEISLVNSHSGRRADDIFEEVLE